MPYICVLAKGISSRRFALDLLDSYGCHRSALNQQKSSSIFDLFQSGTQKYSFVDTKDQEISRFLIPCMLD